MNQRYVTTIGEHQYAVELLKDNKVRVDGQVYSVDYEAMTGQQLVSLVVDGHSFDCHVYQDEDNWHVLMRGRLYTAEVVDEREMRLRAAAGEGHDDSGLFILKAPMPGLVVNVPVKPGDQVKKGDVLVILESMKMQNELKAPRDGLVTAVDVNAGDSVEQKQVMLSLE
ncbi:MAG: biotin/lipoyl-binding protein [Chloroflexi bacterium]|nr:biotin/lipoyl-binding protein [Chloroflexota bacterium]